MCTLHVLSDLCAHAGFRALFWQGRGEHLQPPVWCTRSTDLCSAPQVILRMEFITARQSKLVLVCIWLGFFSTEALLWWEVSPLSAHSRLQMRRQLTVPLAAVWVQALQFSCAGQHGGPFCCSCAAKAANSCQQLPRHRADVCFGAWRV